jgi:septal ring factor EnvC (AmiA/AmiB activator)
VQAGLDASKELGRSLKGQLQEAERDRTALKAALSEEERENESLNASLAEQKARAASLKAELFETEVLSLKLLPTCKCSWCICSDSEN